MVRGRDRADEAILGRPPSPVNDPASTLQVTDYKVLTKTRSARGLGSLIAFSLALLASPPPTHGGDVTAFVAVAAPVDSWGRGYGATLSSTWFSVLSLEGEAARFAGESPDSTMTSFTGAALLAPPLAFLTPYGGIGVGLFRQTSGTASDTGTLKCFVLGLKVKIGLAVLKGEFRQYDLSGDPLLPMERRYALGAGISF